MTEKKYVISEEELKVFYYNHREYLHDFLKSKQEVELVFEGEYLIHSREGSFENPEFWEAMSKINDAKQVKLYIEVVK